MPRLKAMLVVAAVFMTACSPTPEADPSVNQSPSASESDSESEAEPSESEASAEGGTLVVGLSTDPGGLNPAISTSGGLHTAAEIMFNGLVELDDDLMPVPDLAESWEVEDDGAKYTFTLRDDVVWHDGEPFTSADVKYSFEEVLTQFHGRTRASLSSVLDSIDTPDDTTVVFNFNRPYAPFLFQLDVTEAPIIPAHIYEGTDPQENEANNAPVGTGPFKFVSYTPDEEVVVERNPDYFKDGLPLLDEIVMRISPDNASAVLALEAGEIDFLWNVPGADLERLRADDNLSFLTTPRNPGGANCIMTVSFNLERPIFGDANTRRGIASALDRDVFLERVLFGQGRVAEAPIHSGIGFAHGTGLDLPAFDTAESDRLLTEAGWVRDGEGTRTAQGVEGVDDGTPLAFEFLSFPTFSAYGELLKSQLAEVGVDVTLAALEPPVFATTVFTDRNFDTNIISYCNATDPEIGVRRMFDSTQIGTAPFTNSSGYINPEVDDLFNQASGTIDEDARGAIYQQIQEIVVADMPYIWIVETEGTRGFTSDCTGFRPYGLFAEEASCSR